MNAPRVSATLESLVERALGLVIPGRRVVLGIAGRPGAGKSTLATALVAALRAREGESFAAYLPMDGFHLPQARLHALGLRDWMGAPQTIDAAGFARTVAAVAGDASADVIAPGFDRVVEEPVPGAVVIAAGTPIVVAEGNYLLLPEGDWAAARHAMKQVWLVELDEPTRLARLRARHVAFGKTSAGAREWIARVDQPNAELVGAHADGADFVVVEWS